MPFNASDYIKPPAPEFATDREIQGDQVDLKINDLRRDAITCINALAAGAPSGTVTVDSISATPTTITAVKNLTPPVIYGGAGQRVVATSLGTMLLYNCSFDGTNFTADDTGGAEPTGVLLGPAGMTLLRQTTYALPWSTWDRTETFIPGGNVLSSVESGSDFTVYGAVSQTDATVNPITAVVPYGRLLSGWGAPTFTFNSLTNVNMNLASVVMTDVAGSAVKVVITPTAPGDATITFNITVARP